MIEFVMNYCR